MPRAKLLQGIVGFVALVAIVPPLLADYWVFLLTAGLLTTITAMGLVIIVGWTGEVTLAGAGLLGASVYVTGEMQSVPCGGLNAPSSQHSNVTPPTSLVNVKVAVVSVDASGLGSMPGPPVIVTNGGGATVHV